MKMKLKDGQLHYEMGHNELIKMLTDQPHRTARVSLGTRLNNNNDPMVDLVTWSEWLSFHGHDFRALIFAETETLAYDLLDQLRENFTLFAKARK